MYLLALRNLLRQKVRTAMTLASVVFGVAGLILSGGFVQDIYLQLAEALIHSQSGHLQLAADGHFASNARGSGARSIADPQRLQREVAALPAVDDVMARVHFSGLLNNGSADWAVIGEGVEPSREAKLSTYMRVIAGRTLVDKDRYAALVGQGVAQVLKVKPGDQVTLILNTAEGALNTMDLEVAGVFQTFSKDYDARAIRIPLAAAHELLGSSEASVLVVALKKTDDTEAVATELGQRLAGQSIEIRTWRQLNDYYEKTVELYGRQFGVLRVIILIMVLLAVANTINMSTFERVGEFGTMRALGNRGIDVSRLVVVEAVILGLIGGSLGVVVGVILALVISAIGIPMPPPPNANLGYTAFIQIVPRELIQAFLVGVFATSFAALLPAMRIGRIAVVDALRANV